MTMLAIITPVFGVMLLGFIAARLKWFDDTANRGLSLFVFNFAIPPMLFRNLSQADLPAHLPWGYLLSYFLVAFSMFGLSYWSTRRYAGRHHQGASICALSACYGNSVLMGIPLTLTAFGEQATVPLFLLLAMQSPLLMPTVTVALELGRGKPLQVAVSALRGLFSNPVIVALLLGFTWNLLSLPVPAPVNELTRLLGQAATPCALFATGAALSQYRIAGNLAIVPELDERLRALGARDAEPGDCTRRALDASKLDYSRAEAGQAPRPESFAAPNDVPPELSDELAAKLRGFAAFAKGAGLVQADRGDGSQSLLLVFLGAAPAAEPALAKAVAEALAFSGVDAALDVAFLPADDPAADAVRRIARMFDLSGSTPADAPPARPVPAEPPVPNLRGYRQRDT